LWEGVSQRETDGEDGLPYLDATIPAFMGIMTTG